MIIAARHMFGSPIFREIVIVSCWSIWCHRNSIIFDNGSLSLLAWKHFFVQEVSMVLLRVKAYVKALLTFMAE
ncbi:hypothetical protein HU200_050252 [Digitaria exilis]|uniref:Uncharacterized protein n=1 Tax=Digitaria exilis TaxID=1010633 RepID=A0A835E645_9POAL|nr:hypothetical protein HU200_050252 [Digitaria exilis]